MKAIRLLLVFLAVFVPYKSQGEIPLAPGHARLRCSHGLPPAPVQAAVKIRYRAAVSVAACDSLRLPSRLADQAPGHDQILKHLLDDIFHPPA
jgi:hypothetical protein